MVIQHTRGHPFHSLPFHHLFMKELVQEEGRPLLKAEMEVLHAYLF
jgi:hypothetical protein